MRVSGYEEDRKWECASENGDDILNALDVYSTRQSAHRGDSSGRTVLLPTSP